MELQGLYELHERLTAAAVAGVNLVREDFRLKRAVEQIRPLAEAVPVIKKLYKMAEKILSPGCEDRAGCLLDALALSEAVLCTQAGCAVGKETIPLELVTRQYGACQPYRVEAPLERALTEAGSGRLVPITEAIHQKREVFEDYRLQAGLITALADRYVDIASAAELFLSEGDKRLVPLLKKDFQETTENGRIHRLRVIEALAGGEENEFYLGLLESAKRDLREEVIYALRFCTENAEVLLGLVHTERGACLETARQVLGMMKAEDTDDYWEKMLTDHPREAAAYLRFSRSDVVSDKIADLIRQAAASVENEKDKEWNQWMETLILALPGKTSEEIQQIYREAAKAVKPYKRFMQKFAEVLTDSIIYSKDERLMNLARELADDFDRVWLAPALAADFLTKPAMEVFESYKDKVPGGSWLELRKEEKRRGKNAVLSVLGRIHYVQSSGAYEICCRIQQKAGDQRNSLIARKLYEAPAFGWFDMLMEDKIFGERTVPCPYCNIWWQEIGRDEVLFAMLLPEKRQEYGQYFYDRALEVKDNQKLCEILLQCGWNNFQGVAVAYVKHNPQIGINLWSLQQRLDGLPFTEEQRQQEIREVDKFLSRFPKNGQERRRWDHSEIQRNAVDLAAGLLSQ